MKIAILTPHRAEVAAEFAYSLTRMLLRTGRTQIMLNGARTHPELELFMRSSSALPQLRNMLVDDAVAYGADYLLWADSDHQFPDDALLRLLSLNLAVVGVNYPRRARPTWPTAIGLDGEYVWTTAERAQAGEISEVHSLGLGFCLVDMTVIHALRSQGTRAAKPLFQIEMLGDGLDIVGEDVFFFRRIAEAGYAVHLDHALSWAIGHAHQRVLTVRDTLAEKPALQRGA